MQERREPTGLSGVVQDAAERLRQAATLRRPCRSVGDLVGEDVAVALAVQRHVLTLQRIGGATRVGGKVGRRRAGIRSTGVLLDQMRVPDGTRLATSRLLQPRVELKLALTLIEELPADPHRLEIAQVRTRTTVSAAIEITDCRIGGWALSLTDEICDNAGAGLFVVGEDAVPASELSGAGLPARLEVDGELTWRGAASVDDALGDLLDVAVAWHAADEPLDVGDVVLASPAGPTLSVEAGQHYSAYVADLPSATIGFTTSSRLATEEGHL